MEFNEFSRQEYIARINRVMDFIGANLDKPIDLSLMASVASFSPYHFHRIFTCIVGETPNNFLSRVRLEKSAQLLQDNRKMAIGEIAFKCGFTNISSFSRAFRSYFDMSANEFRQQCKAIFIKDGVRYSKNCKPISKIGKNIQKINEQFCTVEFNQLIIMDTKYIFRSIPVQKFGGVVNA